MDRTLLVHIAGLSPLPNTFYYFGTVATTAGWIPPRQGVGAGDKIIQVIVSKNATTGLVTGRAETPFYVSADTTGQILTATAM